MATAPKFETIEQAAEALGIEVNEQTTPYLKQLIKKAKGLGGGGTTSKQKLIDKCAELGLELDFDKENADSLKIRIIAYLFGQDRLEEAELFAAEYKLVLDTETGRVYRAKAKVKDISERNAGRTPGSVGALTIEILQDPEYAEMSVAELVDIFPAFAESKGYPGKTTTPPAVQWYVNYCRKKDIEFIERPTKARAASAGGTVHGAELTLDKALASKAFKKKPVEGGIEGELVDTGANELALED